MVRRPDSPAKGTTLPAKCQKYNPTFRKQIPTTSPVQAPANQPPRLLPTDRVFPTGSECVPNSGPSKDVQLCNVCLYDLAKNAFSKAWSSFLSSGHDLRYDITIDIDGYKIPMLYDMGAAATCLTLDTFQRYFPNAIRENHQTNITGAGNNDIKLYGVYTLLFTNKGQTTFVTYMACEHLDGDILGIDLINELGMSYNAITQQVFAISDAKDTLVATGKVTIGPISTKVVMARYTGHINPLATHVAPVMSSRIRHLQGGPAIVKFPDHKICKLAITNTPPYKVNFGRNEFIGGLDQWTRVESPQPLDPQIVEKFISKWEMKMQKFLQDSAKSHGGGNLGKSQPLCSG